MCYCKEPDKRGWRHTETCCWAAGLDFSLFAPSRKQEGGAK